MDVESRSKNANARGSRLKYLVEGNPVLLTRLVSNLVASERSSLFSLSRFAHANKVGGLPQQNASSRNKFTQGYGNVRYARMQAAERYFLVLQAGQF